MKINNELIKKYKELVDYIEKDVLLCDGIATWEDGILRRKVADLRKAEKIAAGTGIGIHRDKSGVYLNFTVGDATAQIDLCKYANSLDGVSGDIILKWIRVQQSNV